MWFRSVKIALSLITSVLFFSPLQAQRLETQNVEPEARCLSGGILNGYRCKSDDPDYDDGVRYSVQLLQDQQRGGTVFTEPLYHQTHLGKGRSFIYLGEYQTKDEAIAAAAELVAGNNLALEQWRPAIVEIDKSLSIPAIRLVQMYQNESYAYLAPAEPKAELSSSAAPASSHQASLKGLLNIASFQRLQSYFTIQLGSYKEGPSRLSFIRRNKGVGLLCRTKRNGQLAVYTGAYPGRAQAEQRLNKLKLKGYVLKLRDEDMLSCDDANTQILVYSKSSPVAAKQPVAAAKAYAGQSNTAKLAQGKTPKNWEPGVRERFFTVQLAAFKTRQRERRFIDQHQQLKLLCRIRRNGKFAVYSGQFKHAAEARQHMASLPLKQGYVLRLNGELLPACRG